jgi:hypothetical protein
VASAKLPPPVNPYNPPGRRTYECAKAASGRIDLDGAADVLVFGHDPFSDSGVSLQRITDGSVAWRAHVTALGTCRLRYHQVRVRVDGATIVVVDVNVQRVVETRDLATGRQISREVFDYPR